MNVYHFRVRGRKKERILVLTNTLLKYFSLSFFLIRLFKETFEIFKDRLLQVRKKLYK